MRNRRVMSTSSGLGIEGQLRGLARMLEDDRYGIDVVTQIAAARGAQGSRRRSGAITSPTASSTPSSSGKAAEQRRKIAELMAVLSRTTR